MSDSGWRWIGPKPAPAPAPAPAPQIKTEKPRRTLLVVGAAACLVIALALLIQAIQVSRLRRKLATTDAAGTQPAPPSLLAQVAQESGESSPSGRELPRL